MKIRLPKSDALDIQHARREARKTYTVSLGYLKRASYLRALCVDKLRRLMKRYSV
jgi:hypothetical protein